MSKPIAVLISDIHFTPGTLELASAALEAAIDKARSLIVPLIIAGDTLDTKAVIRAECANKILDILSNQAVDTHILVGNHDMLNEKGDGHALEFLRPYAEIIDKPTFNSECNAYFIPYINNAIRMQAILNTIPKGSRIIMHQGVETAFMGHYVQDKTSLPKEAFADYRVISGHYHRAQNIKCGPPRRNAVGLFSYIGNPYTFSFAEAQDGPKGYQVLFDNGLMQQVETNLRKHVILQYRYNNITRPNISPGDIVWVKISGPQSELKKLNKKEIGAALFDHCNFKLDLIPDEIKTQDKVVEKASSADKTLDQLIEQMQETEEQKINLKALWRSLL